MKFIVLAKQVPNTMNVGKNAMKTDGRVNRAALPAIFNPEDQNALEQALRIKEKTYCFQTFHSLANVLGVRIIKNNLMHKRTITLTQIRVGEEDYFRLQQNKPFLEKMLCSASNLNANLESLEMLTYS